MKRLGWIVLGWTGRSWVPYHKTAARTRGASLAKWRRPLTPEEGVLQWEKLRRAGLVMAVRTYIDDGPALHVDGSPA